MSKDGVPFALLLMDYFENTIYRYYFVAFFKKNTKYSIITLFTFNIIYATIQKKEG